MNADDGDRHDPDDDVDYRPDDDLGPAQRPLPLPGQPTAWEILHQSAQHAQVLARDRRRCAWCGTRGRALRGLAVEQRGAHPVLLVIHHLNYAQPARMSYLATLCEACHDHWHGRREPRWSTAQQDELRALVLARSMAWGER